MISENKKLTRSERNLRKEIILLGRSRKKSITISKTRNANTVTYTEGVVRCLTQPLPMGVAIDVAIWGFPDGPIYLNALPSEEHWSENTPLPVQPKPVTRTTTASFKKPVASIRSRWLQLQKLQQEEKSKCLIWIDTSAGATMKKIRKFEIGKWQPLKPPTWLFGIITEDVHHQFPAINNNLASINEHTGKNLPTKNTIEKYVSKIERRNKNLRKIGVKVHP